MMFRSKTFATLLASVIGFTGLHRFYLYGQKDWLAWLHFFTTAMGVYGVWALHHSELHALSGWLCSLVGASSMLAALITALVYGLTPDTQWDQQFNANLHQTSQSGWPVILLVVATMMIGSTLLLTGLAFTIGTYFELQAQTNT